MDRLIVRIIEDIYGWRPTRNNRTSNRKAFHETGWMNYKNLHELCILRFMNRILMNGVPNQLFSKVSKMFYWKEGSKYFKHVKFDSGEAEAERILKLGQGHKQTMIIKEKDINKDMFPYNTVPLFEKLPEYIKETVGTKHFTEMLVSHYKNKCQHRVGKPMNKCTTCIDRAILEKPLDIKYTGYNIQFDPMSYAAYRANCLTMEDVGNVLNNINKTINMNIKQEKTWKQLVKVQEDDWNESKNKDSLKNRKR